MSAYRIVRLDTLDRLRDEHLRWDDLWRRSEVTAPTVRAELVAQWVERFAPARRFIALAIEHDGRFVAAIPLAGRRRAPLLELGALPSNEWAVSGDLLLDPHCDTAAALDALAAELERLKWPLLWLGGVTIDAPRWQALLRALRRAGWTADFQPGFYAGQIDLSGGWQEFRAAWSRNHRRKTERLLRRLEEPPGARFELLAPQDPDEAEHCLRRCFETEDRSWKGRAGSSILRTPKMAEYFVRQARQLAEWNQLEFALLTRDETLVAFEYAYTAKGSYHSFKVSYDDEFASISPGQLLMHFALQQTFSQPDRLNMDCMGPLSGAVAKWRPDAYRVGRIVAAPPRLTSRALLLAYQQIWRRLRRPSSPAAAAPSGNVPIAAPYCPPADWADIDRHDRTSAFEPTGVGS